MKIKLKGIEKITITGEFIKLNALLKFTSAVSTGGEANYMIQSGEVYVDGTVCLQRGRKIRPGNIVRCGRKVFLVA